MQQQGPVALIILDGWGWREEVADNAVRLAHTPNFSALLQSCPHALLTTCGNDVGLPSGQMGNSEVGHMNLGAGRVVYQDLPRIDHAIASGDLAAHPILTAAFSRLKQQGSTLHLLGLASDGGVHSHHHHLLALASLAAKAGVAVVLHLFTDGRDVAPRAADYQLPPLLADLLALPNCRLGTISGRYYAMDRDHRWERVQLAYDAIASARAPIFADAAALLAASYADNINDEFILPGVIAGYSGMASGDAVLMANFRADRVRQLLAALLDTDFPHFPRPALSFSAAIAMTEYSAQLAKQMQILFPPQNMVDGLGELVARAGLTQLRAAETEKYPHVTFFFNGGREEPFAGEDRLMVPSPKVATYDLQPEMSARPLTDAAIAKIQQQPYGLVVLNYANPDMVGHTGDLAAAIKAVEAVDACLGDLLAAIRGLGGVALVTADHGNCELMRDPVTGGAHTAHTLNPVPLLLVGRDDCRLESGRLADIAPSLLYLLGLPQPPSMTGHNLIHPA